MTISERLDSGQTAKFGGRQNQNKRQCFICRATNHFMRECPMYQQKQRPRTDHTVAMEGNKDQTPEKLQTVEFLGLGTADDEINDLKKLILG